MVCSTDRSLEGPVKDPLAVLPTVQKIAYARRLMRERNRRRTYGIVHTQGISTLDEVPRHPTIRRQKGIAPAGPIIKNHRTEPTAP
jgi:hypothetical protein